MTGKSLDLIEENIAQLKALFPEAVTEGKIDFEVLQALLGGEIEKRQTYYKFTWNGKEEARAYARIPSMGTLRPCVEESLGQDGTPGKFDSENLYIEGDNLEVLKLLQGPYHKRVKMIYIDPPYNTGKDFVYPDNYRDSLANYKSLTGQTDEEGASTRANPETSGRYHTDWLNMMYPRLILARNLLDKDGVIFISIADEEVANLRKLCDDVFGEENFITEFIWEKKKKPSFLHHNVGKLSDYIVCYAKSAEDTVPFSVDTTTEGKKYPLNNAGNGRAILTFPPQSVCFNCPDGDVQPQDMSEGNIVTKLLTPLRIRNGRNENEFKLDGEWRYSQTRLDEIILNNEKIVISKIPFRPNHVKDGGEIKKMKNFLSPNHYSMETNEDATEQLISLMGSDCFDNPKPVMLLKYLAKGCLYDSPNAIIMDFFSGSGTMAQAISELNVEDGGQKKYIMVQLPENLDISLRNADASSKITVQNAIDFCDSKGFPHILTAIAKERIRRAAKKIKAENPLFAGDIGFKVFKLDTSNFIPWNPEPDKIELLLRNAVENILIDRTRLDLLYEVLLKCNLPLTFPIEEKKFGENTVYIVGAGALAICLDTKIPQTIAEEIVKLRDEYAPIVPMQVVFRDNGFTDVAKTNALQILKQAGFEEKSVQTI